ncbi:MAG: endonuclease III domain-containing protein [Gammaproteobacteria bacterium]
MTLAGQSASLARGASARLARIDRELERTYGTPEYELGNQSDPLDESVYIILSFQTDLARLKASWESLRRRFPSWLDVRHARLPAVARSIQASGLQVQKAERIKALLSAVEDRAGSLSLDCLHALSDEEAERFLLKLPGLSWKGARCVLLYSLSRARFPVDGNTFRILKRTGVLCPNSVYRRRELHDALERVVPAARRRLLHVNLVVHGQRTCIPGRPRCPACPLSDFCPRIGVDTPSGAAPNAGKRKRATQRGAG